MLPILEWVLGQYLSASTAIESSWVDISRLPRGKISTPRDKLRSAVDIYPCDILFIHRDEDGIGWAQRSDEIDRWFTEAELVKAVSPIPVIPIRMSEAWLLVDEKAIRSAASNPNGQTPLNLPKIHEVEGIADPKKLLFHVLVTASGLSGRKRKQFDRNYARRAIANHMTQQALLRHLMAFQKLDSKVRDICQERDWK